MSQLRAEYESAAAVYIEMLSADVVLARGTAFFVEAHGWVWLVTARHNFTGRNADTNAPLNRLAITPTTLRLWAAEHNLMAFDPLDVNLLDDVGRPLWYEHPELGSRADVAALPVHGLPDRYRLQPL